VHTWKNLVVTLPLHLLIWLWACFLIVGTIVSYIPQYFAIFKVKSSEGLSVFMIAISMLSGFLICINSGILKWSNVICCRDLSFGSCLNNNLATEQLLSGLVCIIVLYLLFLLFYRTEPTNTTSRHERMKGKQRSLIIFIVIIIVGLSLSILGGILYYQLQFSSKFLQAYAQTVGIASGACMVVQYTPQIYTTIKLQSAGSLSIAMLAMQMPGALLVVVFQGFLNEASWTTWVPYVFQAIQQLILIIICTIYWNKERKKDKKGVSLVVVPNEAESLLPATKDIQLDDIHAID